MVNGALYQGGERFSKEVSSYVYDENIYVSHIY